MRLSGRLATAAAVALACQLVAAPASRGQANQDIAFADFQFNRSLPGARSLAMGGAFVALADDATAAYANPSGLTLLTRPEISAEHRWWNAEVTVPARGRISGQPSGEGIDDLSGLDLETFEGGVNDNAFLSAIYTGPQRRWAVGAFRHALARYTARIRSQGVFSDGEIPRFGPYRSSTELNVSGVGVSGGIALGGCQAYSSCLRIGASVIQYSLDLFSRTEVIRDPPPRGRGPASFEEPTLAAATTRGSSNDLVGNAGLLWELGPYWRLAAVYRQGPEFAITEQVFAPRRNASLRLPDQFAIGAAYQPTSAATLSLEYDWVQYSDLRKGNGFSAFRVEDAHEWRLGGEYVFFLGSGLTPRTLALMGGVWQDPDHRVRFDPSREQEANDPNIAQFRRAYFGRSQGDDVHWSLGLGVNFGKFQSDLGVDVSDRTLTIGLSTVVRF